MQNHNSAQGRTSFFPSKTYRTIVSPGLSRQNDICILCALIAVLVLLVLVRVRDLLESKVEEEYSRDATDIKEPFLYLPRKPVLVVRPMQIAPDNKNEQVSNLAVTFSHVLHFRGKN